MAKQGQTKSKKSTLDNRMNLLVSDRDRKELLELASAEGLTISALIRKLIRQRYEDTFGVSTKCSCGRVASYQGIVDAYAAGWSKDGKGWKCPLCSVSPKASAG